MALMLNLTYVQFFKASWYNDRADNRRVTQEAYSQQRGDIPVLTVFRHGQQRIAERIRAVGGDVGTMCEEQFHQGTMSFTDREMDGRRVVVFDSRQTALVSDEPFRFS